MDRGIKKGGLNDPVAQSIRAEQNRDAAPSPEEAQREHRKWLKSQGCEVCDEDDPDKLNAVPPHMHSCSAHQHPPNIEPGVYCDKHKRGTREIWLEGQKSKLHEDDVVAVVIYDCDIVEVVREPEPETEMVEVQVGQDDDGKAIYEMQEQEVQRRFPPRPDVPVKCRGGHGIAEVYYEDDIGPDDE